MPTPPPPTRESSRIRILWHRQDDIFAYDYGADFPEALTVISAAITGGRPLNRSLGPLQILKIVAAAGEYRAPTPRRPGKGKPLPRVDAEKEMENEARMSAQKACQQLIVPKVKSESADAFIRRLDAHRSAPEALIAPLAAPETDMLFVKRMVAVKATYEAPNMLILPRHARETEAEFEERLALCKKTPCLIVFPRGDEENGVQFRTRMGHQARARRPILPKAAGEPEKGFVERCKLQLSCERVIHPFDPKREDVPGYFRRLSAHKERYGLSFQPGDKKALDTALGVCMGFLSTLAHSCSPHPSCLSCRRPPDRLPSPLPSPSVPSALLSRPRCSKSVSCPAGEEATGSRHRRRVRPT